MVEKSNEILRSLGNLHTLDFTPSANQTSYESPIATYTVPAKKMFEIPPKFLGMKLMTKQSFSFTASTTSQTITTTYPIVEDPNLTLVGQNVVVYYETGLSGINTDFTVTAPNTITLNGLTASTAYTGNIYYLFKGGSVNISILSSDGTARSPIFQRDIGNLNLVNQDDIRSGLKVGMDGLLIPERFQIQVRVNSAAPICLYGTTETAYTSPNATSSFIDLPVNISNLMQWPDTIKAYAKSQLMGIS